MSRSNQKTPIFGITTAKSEAEDKKIWHSRFRSSSKQKLKNCIDYEEMIDVHFREVSNPWLMAKDGRQHISLTNPRLKEWMRK